MRENLNRLINENIDEMNYNSIKTAIPLEWKQIVSKNAPIDNNTDRPPQHKPSIIIKGNYKIWSKVTSKDIYRLIIKEKIAEATSIETWENRFLITPNWKEVYNLPYKITSEPYLHSFQYKILNRILNCNDKLYTWGIKKDNGKCTYSFICEEIDTLEHHLYECEESRVFWTRTTQWLEK